MIQPVTSVDLYAKLSYPLLNLIMILIGIPFAVKTGRSGGIAMSIGISVMIGFAYGVTFYIFISFGKSGFLSPFLSAWIPTILFGLGRCLHPDEHQTINKKTTRKGNRIFLLEFVGREGRDRPQNDNSISKNE